MKLAVLTGSVSRLAGGTFEAIKRPMQELLAEFPQDIGVFGLMDKFTTADLPRWAPLEPATFRAIRPKAFGYSKGYSKAVECFHPDIMHVHGIWMHYSYVSLSISKKLKIPYVVNPHGMLDDWAISTSWKKKIAGLIYEKEHLAKATCLRALCVSEAVSMRRYSLKNPICKIPNGIDLPSLPVSCPAPWRDEIEAGKKILLFLGRIHEKKGLKNLVIAWAQLLKENCKFISDWELVIAGWDTTGHQQELGKLVDDLQVRNCVRFIGPQFNNQKIAAYHNADAFVLPSFSEGLPMTVLEAWAYGLPVIMTPQCNIPEGFHENAALKVELDYRSIKMGLLDLFSLSDAERKDIGSHGLSLVKHKFTWGKVAEQINQVNQWILGGGGPPECVQFSE